MSSPYVRALRICLLLLIALLPGALRAQSPSPFALPDRLLESRQYDACALEALRVGAERPELQGDALARSVLCLQLAGDLDAAGALLERSDLAQVGPPLSDTLAFRVCMNALLLSEGRDLGGCPTGSPETKASPMALRARYVPTMAALQRAADPTTVDLTPWTAPDLALLAPWVASDRAHQAAWAARPRKSPAVATLLSALIPGLGRAYLGRWPDAGITFALVATPLAVAGVHYYQRQEVTPLSILGLSVAGAMYAGNLYGAWVGARAYNSNAEEALRRALVQSHRARLLP